MSALPGAKQGGLDESTASTEPVTSRRYGVMLEADFIPEEGSSEMSMRQASALDTVR